MELIEQSIAKEEVEITTVLHDGWTISVRARVADGRALSGGSAHISRAGVSQCRLTTSVAFGDRQQSIAEMVAKADKWVALQASFAASAF
jgi:hypothetical protein